MSNDLKTILSYIFSRLRDDGSPEYFEVRELLERMD